MDRFYMDCREPPKPPDDSISNLTAYVTTRFLAAFGFNVERLFRKGQDTKDLDRQLLHSTEEGLKKEVMRHPSPVIGEILSSAPVALATGVKVAFDASATTKYSGGKNPRLFWLAIVIVNLIYESFLCDMVAKIRAGKGQWFRDRKLDLTVMMCT
jgi:hypothetical protein